MSQSWDEQPWHDVEDGDSPFGGTAPVDGIVYADDAESPELRFSGQRRGPVLPVRPEVTPINTGDATPWRPGPQVDVDKYSKRVPRANPAKGFFIGLAPIVMLALLVYVVASWYGDALL